MGLFAIGGQVCEEESSRVDEARAMYVECRTFLIDLASIADVSFDEDFHRLRSLLLHVLNLVDARGPQRVQTNATEARPTGGKGPYTYAWTTDTPGLTAISPTSAITAFQGTAGPGQIVVAICTCTVTDAAGKTAQSNPVEATIENYGENSGNL